MDDSFRARTRIAKGMDMGHDIMPEFLLVLFGFCHVQVFARGLHAVYLLLSDGKAKLFLRFGQSYPELPPGRVFVIRRKEKRHLIAGITSGKWRLIDLIIHESG